MKKMIVAALLLAVSASFATAQDVDPTIGIYADVDYTVCYADIVPFLYTTVYVAAWLPDTVPAITATEFRVDGLPSPADAIVTWLWTTNLVIGDINFDISLAWGSAQPGPWVLFGQGDFFYLVEEEADHVLTVLEGMDCDCLVVVDDEFNTVPALGYQFTFNCSPGNDCLCTPETATQETNWGSIKALY